MNHSVNKGRFRRLMRLFFTALIPVTFVACSGGGDGGGSAPPTETSFLPFGGGSLYLVNTQDFSDVRQVTSAAVDQANTEIVSGAVFNATSGAYEVGDPAYVVYVADGRLYKKSLTDADAAAVQLSSVSTL